MGTRWDLLRRAAAQLSLSALRSGRQQAAGKRSGTGVSVFFRVIGIPEVFLALCCAVSEPSHLAEGYDRCSTQSFKPVVSSQHSLPAHASLTRVALRFRQTRCRCYGTSEGTTSPYCLTEGKSGSNRSRCLPLPIDQRFGCIAMIERGTWNRVTLRVFTCTRFPIHLERRIVAAGRENVRHGRNLQKTLIPQSRISMVPVIHNPELVSLRPVFYPGRSSLNAA